MKLPAERSTFRRYFTDVSAAILRIPAAGQPELPATEGEGYQLHLGQSAAGRCVVMIRQLGGTTNEVVSLSRQEGSEGALLSSVLRGSHDVENRIWYASRAGIILVQSQTIAPGAPEEGLLLPDEWQDPRTLLGLSQQTARDHLINLSGARPEEDGLAMPLAQSGLLVSASFGVPIDPVVRTVIESGQAGAF